MKKIKNDIEVIEDNKETNNNSKKTINRIFLCLAFLIFIAYSILEIVNYDSFLNFLPKLLGIIFIFLFLICFIIISNKTKGKSFTIFIGSLLVIIYSIVNILLLKGILTLPSDEYVPNFYNVALSDVNKWKEENNITVEENYEYSDTIDKYHVISQDISFPELTKNIDTLTITISLGPDSEKQIIVPNFIGLSIEDILKYANENHLSNVKIVYEISEKKLDTVISQSASGTLKRTDLITFTVARGEEISEVEIIDFTNKQELYAISWLSKYGFKYKVNYEFDDKIDNGYVINQSSRNEVKNPETDEITITVSKGKMLLAPDIASMKQDEINEWVMDNNLKIVYKESYSDDIKLGDVISTSVKENDVIEPDKEIEVYISKGTLAMPKLTSINEFTNWAETNNVLYDINYEYSNTLKKDEIIKCSHKEGQAIKKDDTVIITISSGKSISIPNFVGMSKTNIQNKCTELNLTCSFKTGSYTENTKKDIATAQSKKANTTVSEGTNIVITLSAGIIEKVTIPSFTGKSKSNIQTQCKNLGITCTFKYQSGYSSTAKDICVSQSKTGTVNKGSSITVTLSNGPAKTYTVIIDANQLSSGNPTATKNTLESKLKSACPGVTFTFKYQKANSGIGYLSPNSQVKVGSNTLTQGKTYTVIINSN